MSATTMLHPALDAAEERAAQAAIDARVRELKLAAGHRKARFTQIEDEAERAAAILANRCAVIAEAAGVDQYGDPLYVTADVVSWINHALNLGCVLPKLGPELVESIARKELVPNARLREAALKLGIMDAPEAVKAPADVDDELAALDPELTYDEAPEGQHSDDTDRITAAEVGFRIGETREQHGRRTGDHTRVLRMLGIVAQTSRINPETGERELSCRLFVTYDQAIALADALGLDYHDLGI